MVEKHQLFDHFLHVFGKCHEALLHQDLPAIHNVDALLHLVQALAGEIIYRSPLFCLPER